MSFDITSVIITSLLIFGVNATTRKDKIFGFVEAIVSKNGENSFVLAEAFSECPVCMSSFYGFLGYMYFTGSSIVLDYSDKIILYLMVIATCLEIRDSYIPNKRIPKNIIRLIETVSRVMYISFLVGYAFKLAQLDLILFVLATAGLNSIIETAFLGNLTARLIAANLENANEIELNRLRNNR